MLQPALDWRDGRFCVAGSLYPDHLVWPANVERIDHLPPSTHRSFYNSQFWTLNVTRADMVRAGYSPSVRLFEAAACGTPIISDAWPGLAEIFEPGAEILIARSSRRNARLSALHNRGGEKIHRPASSGAGIGGTHSGTSGRAA